MDPQLEQISRQQRASWNKFSPGWEKWDELAMDFLKPVGDKMISLIAPAGNDAILDVAAGTGEPGLTMATMLGDEGKVVITDLAEDMLEIAKKNAAQKGIENIETRACDVSELPFEANTFDAVSCRFGFMFFPDMEVAAREMARVLKPGGRIAASVWGAPEKNPWVTIIMGTIREYVDASPPPPGAPGMFRCAEDGMMADVFARAGLDNVTETEVAGKLNCGTAETYWNMMTEVAAPIVAALDKTDDATTETIKNDVFQKINRDYTEADGNVVLDTSAVVVYGEK